MNLILHKHLLRWVPSSPRTQEQSGVAKLMKLGQSQNLLHSSILSNSLKGESDLANDPVFSPDALRRERKLHDRPEFRNKTRYGNQSKGGSFATNTEQNEQYSKHLRLNSNSNRVEVSKCPACSNGHNLEKCPEFKNKTLDQRREFCMVLSLLVAWPNKPLSKV